MTGTDDLGQRGSSMGSWNRGFAPNRRIPLLGAALNLLLPGAGYAYSGRWPLAIFAAFLAVAMAGLLAMKVAPLWVGAGLWALLGVDGALAARAANRAGAPSGQAPPRSFRTSAFLNLLLPGAGYLHQRAVTPAVGAFCFWLLLLAFVGMGASPLWLLPFYGVLVIDALRLARARRPLATAEGDSKSLPGA